MEPAIIVFLTLIWAIMAGLTACARANDIDGEDVGAVAAGVLWPIYLPYRLYLIIRTGAA